MLVATEQVMTFVTVPFKGMKQPHYPTRLGPELRQFAPVGERSAVMCKESGCNAKPIRHHDTVLMAFYLLTEHFVDASRQQKKRVYELSGPFGPQTTKTRRQVALAVAKP
jgi:hypothetical protein